MAHWQRNNVTQRTERSWRINYHRDRNGLAGCCAFARCQPRDKFKCISAGDGDFRYDVGRSRAPHCKLLLTGTARCRAIAIKRQPLVAHRPLFCVAVRKDRNMRARERNAPALARTLSLSIVPHTRLRWNEIKQCAQPCRTFRRNKYETFNVVGKNDETPAVAPGCCNLSYRMRESRAGGIFTACPNR